MSYDIYGLPLKEGHCEVHPAVGVPYPCPLCVAERASERVVYSAENPRIQEFEEQLDDFLASDVEAVHFEATDQSQWYATVTLRNGQVWQLKFGAKNPTAKGYAFAEKVE